MGRNSKGKHGRNNTDIQIGGRGNDILQGGPGDDTLSGGKGDDTLLGGASDDILIGGPAGGRKSDDDYLVGGAGNDFVYGGAGQDEAVYVLANNENAHDRYFGGSGRDTLTLVFTAAEWAQVDNRTEVRAYLDHLATPNTRGRGHHKHDDGFSFSLFDLDAKGFEVLKVVVDGQEIDPADHPVSALDDAVSITEDAPATLFGSVLDNDSVPDWVDRVELVEGPALGLLALDPSDGTFTFDPAAAFEGLAEGETTEVTFTYAVFDIEGDSDEGQVTITITGANDAPTMSGMTTSATLSEDETVIRLGRIGDAIDDIDSDDDATTLTYGFSRQPEAGSVRFVGSAGELQFIPGDDFDHLRDGETQDITFAVYVRDSHGATTTQEFTLTVTGANDAPEVTSGPQIETVTEDVTLAATGQITAEDADAGDTLSFSGDATGSYGRFAVDPTTGVWTYALDPTAADALSEGETYEEVFEVTVTDAEGASATQEVTVTITGTNDAPEVTADTNAASDNGDDVTGNVLDNDVDVEGDALSVVNAGTHTGTYGVLTLTASGDYAYIVTDESIDTGFADTEVFTIEVTDGTDTVTTTLTIDITGENDAPNVGNQFDTASDDGVAVSGNVLDGDSDVDGDVLFVENPGVYDGDYGTLTLNADGTYSYVVTDESLAEGQTVVDKFTTAITDGDAPQANWIAFTITGENDAPVVSSGSQSGNVTENTLLTATGQVSVIDPDTGDTATFGGDAAGLFGSFQIDPVTGVWTYTLDETAAVDALAEGDVHEEQFTATVTDASGASTTETIVIGVVGANDAPSLTGGDMNADEDARPVTLDLATLGGDADSDDEGASLGYAVTGAPSEGSATITGTTLTFDPAGGFQDLAAGETREVVIEITATDRHGATATEEVTVTVSGTNDAPVVTSGSQSGSATENTVVTATGQVTAQDVEAGDTLSYTGDASGSYGNFTVDPTTGVWIYALDGAAAEVLAEGETVDEIFGVTITDTEGATANQTVTIEVTGTNDVPTLAAAASTANEDGVAATVDLTTLGWDVDSDDDGASLTYAVSDAPSEGIASISGGTLTFDPAGGFQDLAEGETRAVVIQITATDRHGAWATEEVSVEVTGTNDAPVAAAGSARGDEDTLITGQVTASDVDGDAMTFALATGAVDGAGDPVSGLSFNADGSYSFQGPQDLGGTVSFTFVASDGTADSAPETVTITVDPVNDAPETTVITAGNVSENDGPTTIDLLAGASDAEGDALSVTGVSVTDNLGQSVAFTQSGSIVTIDPDQYDILNDGDARTLTVSFEVTDGQASTPNTATLIFQGVTDNFAPTASDDDFGIRTFATTITVDEVESNDTSPTAMSLDGLFEISPNTYVPNADTDPHVTVRGELSSDADLDYYSFEVATDGTVVTFDIDGAGHFDAPGRDLDLVGADLYLELRTASGTLVAENDDAGSYNDTGSALSYLNGGYSNTIDPYLTQTLDAGVYVVMIGGTIGTGGSYSLHISQSDRSFVFDHFVTDNETALFAAAQLLDNDSDPDGDALSILSVQATSTLGASVTLNPDGSVSYDASASSTLDAMVDGESVEDSFTYTISDGRGLASTATVTLLVDGAEDTAILGGVTTGDVTEDSAATLTTGGVLTISDPDAGDAAFRAQTSVVGTYGTFTLGSDGTWTYSADNASAAVQGIAGGAQVTNSFTAVSKDGSATQVITVTLTGTNDGATISGDNSGTVWRDFKVDGSGDLVATGDLDLSDPDTGEELFTAQSTIVGTFGTFSIDADGQWTYRASNTHASIQGWAYGGSLTDSATVTSIDGTASEVLTVDILTELPARIGGNATGSVTRNNDLDANGFLNAGGTLTITDNVASEEAFVEQTATLGSYGSFTLASDGSWSYEADNTQAAVQGLDQGEELTDRFTVTSIDGTEKTVTITLNSNVINGNNNANTLNGTSANDEMFGLLRDDILYGNGGEDILWGGTQDDRLFGGSGADILHGGNDADYLSGDGGDDELFGDAGNDTLYGGTGGDELDGGSGADSLWGQDGDDLLIADTNDTTLSGGDGVDTLSFATASDDIYVNLNLTTDVAGVVQPGGGSASIFAEVRDIENVTGGSGDDILVGDGNDNVLEGGDGNDTLSGKAGEDTLIGGDGDDILAGGANIDWLTGGAGADTFLFTNGQGQDRITDFDTTEDMLDFSNYGVWASFAELMDDVDDGSVIVFENAIGPGFGVSGVGYFVFQNADFDQTDIWDHITASNTVF